MENDKETIFAIVAIMFSAICLLGLVLALVHVHDLKRENAALVKDDTTKHQVVKQETASISAPDLVTITERDIENPGNSGLLDRRGRVAFLEMTDALSQLGLAKVSVSASGSSCIITGGIGEDTITLQSKRLSEEEDRDEVFSLSASIYIRDERIVSLMRDQRVTIAKDAFLSSGSNTELSPILLFYDRELDMMISERELDCLNWILVNQIPENIEYVEDVLYCPGNSKNTS